eukprot:860718-Pyramimonas_sp.AAC.1
MNNTTTTYWKPTEEPTFRVSKTRVLSKRLILIILQYNFKLSHGVRLCDGYVMSVGGSLQHLHEQLSSLKTEIVQSGDRPQLSELLDTVERETDNLGSELVDLERDIVGERQSYEIITAEHLE